MVKLFEKTSKHKIAIFSKWYFSDSPFLLVVSHKEDMHHLNASETCIGKYTFESLNGKSAIDHVLTNDCMKRRHLGMWIDEERTMLNISDHNLVRTWFKLKPDRYKIKKKKPKKKSHGSVERQNVYRNA